MAYGMYYFMATIYYLIYIALAIALLIHYPTEHPKARIVGICLIALVLTTTTAGLFIL